MSESFIDQLKQLNHLAKVGAIDQGEFSTLKAAIIARVVAAPPSEAVTSTALPTSLSGSVKSVLTATTGVSNSSKAEAMPSSNVNISALASSSKREALHVPVKSVQSTLHKYFGNSIIEKGGSKFMAVDCPSTIPERFQCQTCGKKCQTSAALIAHRKIHLKTESLPSISGSNSAIKLTRKNRGSKKRHRYSFQTKSENIVLVDNLMKNKSIKRSAAINQVSVDTGIPSDTISKWFCQRETILAMANEKTSSSTKGLYNRAWLPSLRNLEELLARMVRARRREGLKAKRLWVMATARQILKMPLIVNPDHAKEIKLSRHWYYAGFLNRSKFSIRRSSNRKQADVVSAKPAIYRFHCELLSLFRQEPQIDPLFGHYAKRDVFNFDQIPLPFVCDSDSRTVDDVGAKRVWCRQPGSGLEKRQATMHLTLCADDDAKQPKPIIIFRGTGKNVMRSSEVQEWDSRVSVLFQSCAWVDTDVANMVVSLYEKDPAFSDNRHRLMLCDNLDAHRADVFVKAMERKIGKLVFYPPNLTHMLQPIDAGAGRSIKFHMANSLDVGLENPAFLEKWTSGKFTARQRRVLMTKWAGDAFDKIVESRRIGRYFLKTGSLLRVDGRPNPINVQGLPEYAFPPSDGSANVRLVIDLNSDDVSEDASDETHGSGFDSSHSDVDSVHFELSGTVIVEQNGFAVAECRVMEDMKSVHNNPILPSQVVVVLDALYQASPFGFDTFGEPIGVGAFVPLERSWLRKIQ